MYVADAIKSKSLHVSLQIIVQQRFHHVFSIFGMEEYTKYYNEFQHLCMLCKSLLTTTRDNHLKNIKIRELGNFGRLLGVSKETFAYLDP